MNRIICLLYTLFLLIGDVCYAQRSTAYFNDELIFYVQKQNNPNEELHLLVQGDLNTIQNFMHSKNGRVLYQVQDIASVRLTSAWLSELLHTPGIKRVEGYHGCGQILDEQTDIQANITPVKDGNLPLTQSYTGKDVVVGIIDTGIEINHDDFRHENGQTRIKYLWDQSYTSGGTTPSFGYGQEWDSTAIQNGLCTHTEAASYFGHGSNVTGAATGNGLALNKYQGVAPEADIISVACDLGQNFLNNVADATAYIYQHAQQLGKPCIISASVGIYRGSHDGADLPAQFISALIKLQNGRSFCASAGNAGNILLHLGYEVEADSAYTWFRYEPTINSVYYEVWASKINFNNVYFSFGVDKPAPSYAKRTVTQYFNILSNFNLSTGIDSLKDTIFVSGNRLGILNLYALDYNDSTYKLIVHIFPDSTSYLWRFTTKGSGYFDCWSQSQYTGTSNTVKVNLPDVSVYPDIARYRMQDRLETVVSSFTCSQEVIAVANFVNRNNFVNYNGATTSYASDTVGARVSTSSIGPSRDKRLKPEITAPGGNTLAPGQLSTLAQFILNDPTKVAEGGLHNVNGGTSMAAPVVGGIIALYFQKKPTASWKQIRDAIQLSAKEDMFTGINLPDTKWGWGKINAFDMLTTNIVYGCTDSSSINYNPIATIDDGSCIYDTVAIVYGCMDTNALNYNPLATLDDGSCVYDTTHVGVNLIPNITFFPNPIHNSLYIHQSVNLNLTIIIYDVTGRIMLNEQLSDKINHTIDFSLMHPGIYICELQEAGKRVKTLKLTKL